MFNPRVNTTLDNIFFKIILVTFNFSTFILFSGGVSPGRPLKIENQFFLHFVWEGVREFSGKFREFSLSCCVDIARLLHQNLLSIKRLIFKKRKIIECIAI